MERIENIITHKDYKYYLDKIEDCEKERIFCRHDRKHFLDVCRISYLLYLEDEQLQKVTPFSREEVKELLYAAGLLHDIGRWREYEEGISHEIASADLAESILKDACFDQKEIELILELILSHRNKDKEIGSGLSRIFSQADKQSRECFWCMAADECNWKEERKNRSIRL